MNGSYTSFGNNSNRAMTFIKEPFDMSTSIDNIIADALKGYLEASLREHQVSRAFFRLYGFDQTIYAALLDNLARLNWRLGGMQLEVRSIAAIPGYDERMMAPQRSATWYRNHLKAGHALILIQNRRSTDAQSLKDLYPVTESSLTTDGLVHLIAATCVNYQLKPEDRKELETFIHRFGQKLFKPQLRNLTEFLFHVDTRLAQQPSVILADAIARALPYLGLFQCLELAQHINTLQGDRILRQLHSAAGIGNEVFEESKQAIYLKRLETAPFDDDSVLNGYSAEEKRTLLRQFIEGRFRNDRIATLRVLQIDWREVQHVITIKTRSSQAQKLKEISKEIEAALSQGSSSDGDLAELIATLNDGREPEADLIDRVLQVTGDSLNRQLRSKLRRLVKTRTRKHSDFLVGLTSLAIELLYCRQDELQPGTRIRVELDPQALQKHDYETLATFRTLFGGIEQVFANIEWNLEAVWEHPSEDETAETGDDDDNQEKERWSELPFRVVVLDADGHESARADLIWQYRFDSPATATYRMLETEWQTLKHITNRRLRIPIFKRYSRSEDVSDLDIHRPLKSFGNCFEQPEDLRIILSTTTLQRFRPQARTTLFEALDRLEDAWGQFVWSAMDRGLLAADIDSLLEAYTDFLHTAITNLQTSQEVTAGFRVFSQAWMIGAGTFEPWAVMPLLHPLKLHWWRERARYFSGIIRQLLNPTKRVQIVDERRLRRELAATYGSSQFPPILALPPKEGAPPEWFVPVEEADGYELFLPADKPRESFSSATANLSVDEAELAARRTIEGITTAIQDYIETYPFVADGLELVLLECQNSALPELLIEQLTRSEPNRVLRRISLLVHTNNRGAPLFQRISEWTTRERDSVDRSINEYFPPISLNIRQCALDEILSAPTDKDLVILADVLAQRGQRIRTEISPSGPDDVDLKGFLPIYRAQQEPFERGELYRRLRLHPTDQPTLVRYFLLTQYAALEGRKVDPKATVAFYRELNLDNWKQDLEKLHHHFNWVICYDRTIDRFLLQATLPETVQIIRYSLGLGEKRQHNLTVSSSHKPQVVVQRRLASRLKQMLPAADRALLDRIAAQLIEEAKQISGDIVLRAAGPGTFLNELIGIVAAKFETERRVRERYPNALITWIFLDDFEHWFSGKFPDLLCVVIDQGLKDTLKLHLEILEAKCVSQHVFDRETLDAEEQVRRGVSRFAHTFAPGAHHLDSAFWYDQLYRAVTGNLILDWEQQSLWELFRQRLHRGDFEQTISGHAWMFCYDGQVGIQKGPEEVQVSRTAPDAPRVPLYTHRYGRTELCHLLREIVEHAGSFASEGVWSSSLENANPESTANMLSSDLAVGMLPAATSEPHATINSESEPVSTVAENIPRDIAGSVTLRSVLEPRSAAPSTDEQSWLEQTARNLERALRQRSVRVLRINPSDADIGPSIVRFKVRLSHDETLRKTQSVATDLARDLALDETPLIANIPGTPFVGIDLPRPQPEIVPLHRLLDQLPQPATAELPIIVGVTPDGNLVIDDLSEFPHLLVAGVTNSGKSVFLRNLLLSLIKRHSPTQLELLIIDPKCTDFTFFNQLPHLRGGKVITEQREAKEALLELAKREMSRRQQIMGGRSLKIKQFNLDYPDEALPSIVALIDEYHLLISHMDRREREAFEQYLNILAAAARSVGIHLVVATQRPSADIITPNLKANLGTQIAFRVATGVNSRVVIDETGAEHLIGRGDMLFRSASGRLTRLQAPFMSENELFDYLKTLR